jgi:hypothetical protein
MLESAWGAEMSADCDATSMPKTFWVHGWVYWHTSKTLWHFAGGVQSTIRTLGPAPPAAPSSFSRAYPPVLVQLVAASSGFVFLGSHHLSTDLHNSALSGLCKIGVYVKADVLLMKCTNLAGSFYPL